MDQSRQSVRYKLTDVCAGQTEMLALSITRFIAAGYMTSDVACWEAAYDAAERAVGEGDGAALVARLTDLMRAIRAERAADWSFMPPNCCRVTGHEEELVRLLKLGRAGLAEALAEAAGRLTGTEAAPGTTAAASRAAAALDEVDANLLAHRAVTPSIARH